MSGTTLEICVDNIESAYIAEEAGANRIELCQALDVGGLTPAGGLVLMAKQKLKIPVFMMIRPRPGDFFYTSNEYFQMLEDIDFGLSMGVDGFVTGVLSEDCSEIDKDLCYRLVRAASGKPVTFHRAFDLLKCDLEKALNDVIDMGFSRILTSGRARTAYEGKTTIKDLVKMAGSRIVIMPGCGISVENIQELYTYTKAKEYHSSGQFHNLELDPHDTVVKGTSSYPKADKEVISAMRVILNYSD